ncbi:4Fe-4S cluster-binding domain-containing protein [Heliobacterium undosum]|uniref:Anaerobic ribonucleoside-triphosphate reductase-activating protein n=1 Tax=Heliomicrobium undosum TaxID=121734 RepID=A0A845KYN2_9FIRM|nr:4Fe-4S single cluster domain-containing protein [Heliomicrobium undosum]MZP28663.1 4Fe-4S cluster-binding domain-containing protein [Heliomicrobium undosum]
MQTVRVAGFHDFNTTDANGIAFSIFFQGCRKRCPGCHNPELQPMDGGEEMAIDDIFARLRKHRAVYDSVVFLGGEPMEQPEALRTILAAVKSFGLETWLYTGYDLNKIPEVIIDLCDVIVAGEYREDLRTGAFPASSNQIVYHRRKERVA